MVDIDEAVQRSVAFGEVSHGIDCVAILEDARRAITHDQMVVFGATNGALLAETVGREDVDDVSYLRRGALVGTYDAAGELELVDVAVARH